MAKAIKPKLPRTLEDWLAALRGIELAAEPDVVRGALALSKGGAGVVIAAVAKRAAEQRADVFVPELVAAFGALCKQIEDGEVESDAEVGKRDPNCTGKLAIATALHDLDHWDDSVFVTGLRVTQLVGMPPSDTAAGLRGMCGLAHAHFARPDCLDVLAALLADPEVLTRTTAAQGVGDYGHRDGTALLRYKLLDRGDDPDVLAQCFDSLLSLAPDASAAFAIDMLGLGTDDRAAAAALALGGARVASAREPLVRWCERGTPDQRRRVGYVALALLRDDDANAYLLDSITSRSTADAIAAAKALATFKHVDAIAEALRTAFATIRDKAVRRELDALLD